MLALISAHRGSPTLWSALPLASLLLLVLLLGLGAPTGVEGFVHGEYPDPVDREGLRGQHNDRFADVGATEDVGYSYVPEGELMDNEVSDTDLENGERESRNKRERCYCDLDLFCKRFGCRRRKRVSAQRMYSEAKRVAASKTDLLLQLARRLSQNGRSYHSQ